MKCIIAIMIILTLCHAGSVTKSWNFDDVPEGSLPAGWKIEATGRDKAAAKWQVIRNTQASLGPGVLSLIETNHTQSGVFNICWTNEIFFLEGEIAVFLKANSGKIDQGVGLSGGYRTVIIIILPATIHSRTTSAFITSRTANVSCLVIQVKSN